MGDRIPNPGHVTHLDVRQGVRVDPSLIQRSRVLSLTQHELEQAIEAELSDNPALERLETETEPITEEQVLRTVAPHELRVPKEDREMARSLAPDDPIVDWTELAPTTNSLRDHVLAQVIGQVDAAHASLAAYMVDCLNERGYLESSLEEIALARGATLEDVEAVLAQLHRCEPAGVGARNLIECLQLQLRDAATIEERLAREIVTNYVDELIARRTGRIARRFKVMPNVVEAAFQVVAELQPNPAEGFAVAPSSLFFSDSVAVRPDLILTRTELGWEVEPRGGDPTLIRINDGYRRRKSELKHDRHADPAELAHVAEYTQRAELFLQSLKDRRRTLRQVGLYLVEHQAGFVSTGRYEFLAPLTRFQLAHKLGVHESTISRATMGKFVQIATGDIVSFDVFFKPALRVQKMIEEILQNENPSAPLSDERIAQILASRGVEVARRTVNKYRDRSRMLNSRTRKSA